MKEIRVATFRAVAASAAALLLGGCAAISQSMAANKRSPGVIENGAFKPALPPAESYGPNPKYTCPTGSINDAVQGVLKDRFKGKTVPEQEGRLCAMAETLLGWQGQGDEMPPESVRAFLSNYFGMVSTVRQVSVSVLDSDDARVVMDPLAEPIATFGEGAKAPRYGLVTTRLKKGPLTAADVASQSQSGSKAQTRFALTLQDQIFELTAPLPRQLPLGGSAPFQARALGPVSKVKTEVVDAAGKLKTIPSQDQTVEAQLSCGDKPGKILVQVSGETEGIDTQLANFTVACGGSLATEVKLPAKAVASTPAQDEQRVVELINAERQAAGIPPLENYPALANISRKISEDLASGKGTTSSQLMQSMRDADIGSPVVIEAPARGLSAADAFDRLANTASGRATILNSDANQIGVGVAAGPPVGKVPTVIVTALMIKNVPPADPKEIKAKLYEAIAQRRKDGRAEPLTPDAVLEDIAQKYADAAAEGSGVVSPEKQSEILKPLYQQSMTVNQVGGFVADQQAAIDVAQQPTVMGNAKLVGAGVALGRSPQFGKNAPFVVVFFGTRHQVQKAAPPRKKKR